MARTENGAYTHTHTQTPHTSTHTHTHTPTPTDMRGKELVQNGASLYTGAQILKRLSDIQVSVVSISILCVYRMFLPLNPAILIYSLHGMLHCMHMYTRKYTHTHSDTHTFMHACTRARAHTHTHPLYTYSICMYVYQYICATHPPVCVCTTSPPNPHTKHTLTQEASQDPNTNKYVAALVKRLKSKTK